QEARGASLAWADEGVCPYAGLVWHCSGGDGSGASSGVGFADCGDWVSGVCDWGGEGGGASGGCPGGGGGYRGASSGVSVEVFEGGGDSGGDRFVCRAGDRR